MKKIKLSLKISYEALYRKGKFVKSIEGVYSERLIRLSTVFNLI